MSSLDGWPVLSHKCRIDVVVQVLVLLQPRIEAWLGRIGAHADALALPLDACGGGEHGVVQWDPAKKLTITLRYPDEDVAVWLGRLLPDVSLSGPSVALFGRHCSGDILGFAGFISNTMRMASCSFTAHETSMVCCACGRWGNWQRQGATAPRGSQRASFSTL